MIRIIADSTCDLSKEIIKLYGIKVISSKVVIDGKVLNDYDYDGDILNEFYTTLDTVKEAPGYQPPASNDYVEAIEEGVFNGVTEFIIFIPSSQQIDDFPKVVGDAMKDFEESNKVPGIKVKMVNTINVSQGFGYTVLKAAKMLKKGASYEEIIETCEANKTKIKDLMAVPDVDFLYKTGNVTKAGAKATKMLGITPVLKLGTTGKATLASKMVGEDKVAQCFTNEFKHQADIENSDFVIIGYSTDEDRALAVKNMLVKEGRYRGEVHVMQMRPAFGAHMGKRAVTIYFLGKHSSIALFDIFRFH